MHNPLHPTLTSLILTTLLLIFLIPLSSSQSCLDHSGQPVSWWVIFKVPPKIGAKGYGYYDSNMRTGKFRYYDQRVDVGSTPLVRTELLINSEGLHHVAWNDQKPSGQTSSSLAHSKGLISYSPKSSKGYFLSHSIPKYPSFSSSKINPQIASSQNIYGQHLSCFSLTLKQLNDLAGYMLISMPFIYEAKIDDSSSTNNLFKLSRSAFPRQGQQFNKHDLRSAYGYTIKMITKNDIVNGSIFQDGLTSYLGQSQLIAQTWGRPIQAPYCNHNYQVFNAVTLKLDHLQWTQQDDHSKWVVAGSLYVCFGDMNRMSSQWKRGGSFYCLSEKTLVEAVRAVVVTHDRC